MAGGGGYWERDDRDDQHDPFGKSGPGAAGESSGRFAALPAGARRARRLHLSAQTFDSAARIPTPEPAPGSKHLTLPSQPAVRAMPRDASRRPRVRSVQPASRRIFSSVSQRLHRRHDTWDDYVDDAFCPPEDGPAESWPSRRASTDNPRALATREDTWQERGAELATRDDLMRLAALDGALPTASVPDLMAYHPALPQRRAPSVTRAIVRRASQPWSLARLVVAAAAIVLAICSAVGSAGEASAQHPVFRATSGPASNLPSVTSKVTPITQLIRCDQYDSQQQCQDYGNAACSAAATTEVLTAWDMPGITIGKVIDEMGDDISANGGMLNHAGFQRVAVLHGFRADLSTSLTYDQMLYIVDTLRIPLIVDVRMTYGYYRFFAGGHFLVMTGGDGSGVQIADSSEYYIHYLPRDVFMSMFTGSTTLLVPQGYQYSLPA